MCETASVVGEVERMVYSFGVRKYMAYRECFVSEGKYEFLVYLLQWNKKCVIPSGVFGQSMQLGDSALLMRKRYCLSGM